MTFADEDTRTAFHLLPTHTQYEWSQFADFLHKQGRTLHITGVQTDSTHLEVSVRIHQQFQ